jgi:hypothetical protein
VNAREVRDYVKAKAHLIQSERPDPLIDLLRPLLVICLRIIRDDYIRQVGLPTYLSQMLYKQSAEPMSRCTLVWSGGRRVQGVDGQQVQKYIAARCGNDLPDIVRIRLGDGKEVERYL